MASLAAPQSIGVPGSFPWSLWPFLAQRLLSSWWQNGCSCSQHHLMCPFQSHLQVWGLESPWLWLARAIEEPKCPVYLVASFSWDLSARPGISWGVVMEEQQGRPSAHGRGMGVGGTGPAHKKALSARQGADPGASVGGREQTGRLGSIIRSCWVPTYFHQVLTAALRGQAGPSCLAESWVMWGACHGPWWGTWEVTLFCNSPAHGSPSPHFILFQAHSLCPEVLRPGAQLYLH